MALTTILVGACVTHFFGEQGEIHLRADKAQTLHHTSSLPFREGSGLGSSITLFLWDFQVVYDEHNNPVDYITDLRLLDRSDSDRETVQQHSGLLVESGIIRMNKPLIYKHWRFCQSNFDSDQLGVTLRYNYDPWGIGITYTGYPLLLVAMIAFFFQPHSRFRALLKSLTAERSNNAVVLQRSGLAALAVIAILLTIIMTKVVTPKPPLQPVLQTPLLGIHVSVIMLAYTLFAIIAINGIIGLCSKRLSPITFQLSTVLLYPAEFCLMAGIFIGAVWANMSWGRYWGWDPKETWALITMLVYALLLHFPWLKRLLSNSLLSRVKSSARSDCRWPSVEHRWVGLLTVQQRSGHVLFHIVSIVAFLFVLFTYFGVKYLLGGLHSYAN